MRKLIYLFIVFFSLVTTKVMAQNIMILKLSYGEVEIELYPEKAPNHVERFKKLAEEEFLDVEVSEPTRTRSLYSDTIPIISIAIANIEASQLDEAQKILTGKDYQ